MARKATKRAKKARGTPKKDAKGLLSATETAKLLGITRQALDDRVAAGLPIAERRGKIRKFDPDVAQAWSSGRGLDGTGGRPKKPRELTQKEKLEVAAKALRTKQLEQELKMEAGLADLGLGQRIRAIRSTDDLVTTSREALALFLEGKIPPKRARMFKALLSEHRLSLVAQAQTTRVGQRQVLCTDEGWRLVRVFEGIVDDKLRVGVLRACLEASRKDLELHPNKDRGGVAAE